MKVMVHRGPTKVHILNEERKAICGSKLHAPFGVNAMWAKLHEIDCKRCLQIWAKKQGENVT